jgi:D-lactate dehydrogenase (cytochrome)
MTPNEAEKFNQFRYSIPESINDIVRRTGMRRLSTDVAVPEKKLLEMMNFYVSTLTACGIEHVVFGHIGECHLHVNLLPKNEAEHKRSKDICLEFIRKGVSLGGTVSAEHGIGKTRREYLEEMYGKQGVLEMAKIKKAMDPNWILGLDNIFSKDIFSAIDSA